MKYDVQVECPEPRWLTAEEQQDWHAFSFASALLPAALEAQMQRDSGMTHFDYRALSGLSMAPDHRAQMTDLARYTGSSLSRLSNVVSRFEKRGWVTRRPDTHDRRATVVTLTDDGLAVVEQAAPAHVAEVRRLVVDALSPAQFRALGDISRTLLRAMGAPTPPRVPVDGDNGEGDDHNDGARSRTSC
ncbi:MarR family winged helix-turn-helix transcriptional regulator [Serinibacter salmoneus]|uniref:DNA-binding MarR family transcriptional regulator n=1 Tax=Serinibacter salmoneus TaxID=556530 RepID=A0A2A9D4L6_9MICO|nr:MarR family winged helix-turn-helix transcriptional regulator [Serinibacter salmoneus]PFG21195.1 DNA-binding MarR family transcriptional regulator [Serinibacter salmoneus]